VGASTDYRVFNHNDKSKIELEWNSEVEQSKREDGCSYSGQIGMLGSIGSWEDKKFITQEQAGEALFELHDKWDDALAVSFLLEAKKDKKVQRKLDGLQERVVKVNKKSKEYVERSQKNFFDSSIKFATCKSCESKLRRELLHKQINHWGKSKTDCVLCGESLFSNTVNTRIKDYALKSQELYKEIEELEKSLYLKSESLDADVGWVIGGWCSS
jgi:superfamily II helicase